MSRCALLRLNCKDNSLSNAFVVFHSKLVFMSKCALLCQDIQFYVDMCIFVWFRRQFSLEGLCVVAENKILCPNVQCYVKMFNSMSRCAFLCLIVSQSSLQGLCVFL